MIDKIKILTHIFLKDYYQNLNIKNKKNIKSKYMILLIIAGFALAYLSYKSINFSLQTGEPQLFLKIYLPIFAIIIISQLIILVCRLFYYSNDLEYILPHPLKTEEILIAKLNTIIIIMYFMEAMFLVIPLIMYGLIVTKSILYFIFMIMMIAIFPIFFTLIISILMLFLMKLSKLIKNKEIFQIIIVTALSFILYNVVFQNIEQILLSEKIENINQVNTKLDQINNMFLIINPIIKVLTSREFKVIILNIFKIIIVNISTFLIFVILGKKLYLKNVLMNINYIRKNNKAIKENKYKKNNKIKTYIKNDMKKIIKTPSFFMQNIFQNICLIIIFLILLNVFIPVFIEQMETENMIEQIGIENFKIQLSLIVVEIIQIVFTFSNLSLTAISREGKNAVFMKYIPIPLKKQITLKVIPQIIINTFIILATMVIIHLNVNNINIIYYIIIFILSMLLNFINSYLMILIDLKKPNLNWTNEESVAKNNENKLYPYIFTIVIFLILNYFNGIFQDCNFIISMLIINTIFLIFFIILKIYINKNINKIFDKIY